jgi:hypothetical protein
MLLAKLCMDADPELTREIFRGTSGCIADVVGELIGIYGRLELGLSLGGVNSIKFCRTHFKPLSSLGPTITVYTDPGLYSESRDPEAEQISFAAELSMIGP